MYQFLLTIKNENCSNPRTVMPEKVAGDMMHVCLVVGKRPGWGEEVSEKGSVKQTIKEEV